jgi:hypothetical protein
MYQQLFGNRDTMSMTTLLEKRSQRRTSGGKIAMPFAMFSMADKTRGPRRRR